MFGNVVMVSENELTCNVVPFQWCCFRSLILDSKGEFKQCKLLVRDNCTTLF